MVREKLLNLYRGPVWSSLVPKPLHTNKILFRAWKVQCSRDVRMLIRLEWSELLRTFVGSLLSGENLFRARRMSGIRTL
jgi:hypothetical protein